MASDAAVKVAATLVELRNPNGQPPHGASVWVCGHWVDSCGGAEELADDIRGQVSAELDAFAAGVLAERDGLARERSAVIDALGIGEDIDVGRDPVDAARAVRVSGSDALDMLIRAESERDAARATLAEARAAWAALEASWPGWRAHADALATLRRVLGGA